MKTTMCFLAMFVVIEGCATDSPGNSRATSDDLFLVAMQRVRLSPYVVMQGTFADDSEESAERTCEFSLVMGPEGKYAYKCGQRQSVYDGHATVTVDTHTTPTWRQVRDGSRDPRMIPMDIAMLRGPYPFALARYDARESWLETLLGVAYDEADRSEELVPRNNHFVVVISNEDVVHTFTFSMPDLLPVSYSAQSKTEPCALNLRFEFEDVEFRMQMAPAAFQTSLGD